MPTVKIQSTGKTIDNQEDVITFLKKQGVIYEQWDITKLSPDLQNKFVLNDDEQQRVLDTFKTEINDIANKRGYKSWDIVTLNDQTPNLNELLGKFKKEHHHADDEVRFTVNGHGVFVIQGKDGGFFEVHLNPGDLISVPQGVRHYFTLAEDRKIVSIRIFTTKEGWVAIY